MKKFVSDNLLSILIVVFCLSLVVGDAHCQQVPSAPAPTSECSVDTKKMSKEAKKLQALKCQLEQVKVQAAIEVAKRVGVPSAETPTVGVAQATTAVTVVTHRQEFDEKGHLVALEGSKEWKKLESLRVKKNAEVEKAKAYSLNPCAAGWLARPSWCHYGGYGYGSYGPVSPYGSYGGRW